MFSTLYEEREKKATARSGKLVENGLSEAMRYMWLPVRKFHWYNVRLELLISCRLLVNKQGLNDDCARRGGTVLW